MSTARTLAIPAFTLPTALVRLLDEVALLAWAFANPNRVIAEVEASRERFDAAARIEARDPQRAAQLRREGAAIGLR